MRIISEQDLAKRLGSLAVAEPRIVVSGNWATPKRALQIVDENVETCRVFMIGCRNTVSKRPTVRCESPFLGAGMRHAANLDYIPLRLSLAPQLFATSYQPDVVVIHTSTPRAGKVSLGIEVNIIPTALDVARARGALIVAQINPKMPYTFGEGEIPTDMIDIAIEVEEPLDIINEHAADPQKSKIGERIAGLIPDGATLQAGIGAIPDATLGRIGDRRGLRIWSEMISDGVLRLERAGALDPDHEIATSFLGGSQELYEWVDGNPRVRLYRTETTNDPGLISHNRLMVSINAALQMDLYTQANACFVGGHIFSGFGGQTDFIVGAIHSPGGQAIIGLPSWHEKSQSSTIVPLLNTPVTSFQHSVVVTDQGCAHVLGRCQRDQARLLIEETAAPQSRDELWKAAKTMGLAN